MTDAPDLGELATGDEVEVVVGPVAHGGHCVARHEGRVVFVRHTLPGERVRVRITEARPGQRFVRADAVDVLEASPHRVAAPCPYAGPGLCGGCDFQHVELSEQRHLKASVVREQFARLAGLDVDIEVEAVPGDRHGLGWRTRVEFAVDAEGRPGLRRHRSHDVLTVEDCLIAHDRVREAGVLGRSWPGERAVDVVAPSTTEQAVVVPVPSGEKTAPVVRESVRAGAWEATFEVGSRGFWQVHPGAAATFVDAVLQALGPRQGERAVDLYAGVGLFALALADAVGPDGAVLAVEAEGPAMASARRNTRTHPWVELRPGRVDKVLKPLVRQGIRADLVVLDPPRTGAGRQVAQQVASLGPRVVAYVACDPAALARDTAYLKEAGYGLRALRAFDAFPMTHHVECLAVFEPQGA
ncbi:class I SAM-dependent RNA methyltransferase [Knoellia sp. p5-6-4]|uniref:class I SAM-dependent RNA methyltransferase n=1 Tax=unclassified Knoellia TaxID=2618719 RepID=UPI0023DB6E6A|nr:class I SAM-dependent RNA methyltransferase [Knoellia sp. p5-6-4]MDF2143581.1 class I SAM-dependent RNA methyltransferase [Knoellia sp. p5-6-4]